jgi:hypothetical protein
LSDGIEAELRKRYKVDESFYPKLDMIIDFPKGLHSEIERTMEVLKLNGFAVTAENVYSIKRSQRKGSTAGIF